MREYVICLLPEERLGREIMSIKKELLLRFGEQRYLLDPAHVTLYVARLDKKDIESFLATQPDFGIIETETDGWYVFEKDIFTGKDTVVCRLKSEKLNASQDSVIRKLSGKRVGVPQRYMVDMPRQLKENVEKTGFPFAGSVWIPHISLGSFEDSSKVMELVRDRCPKGRYRMEYLAVFELKDDKIKEIFRRKNG